MKTDGLLRQARDKQRRKLRPKDAVVSHAVESERCKAHVVLLPRDYFVRVRAQREDVARYRQRPQVKVLSPPNSARRQHEARLSDGGRQEHTPACARTAHGSNRMNVCQRRFARLSLV